MDISAPDEIPPEGELLLCFARLALGPEEHTRIRQLLDAGPNWEVLLELASAHGLQPLLYQHLEAMGNEAVPSAVFARVWCSYERALQRNRTMAAELSRIADLLESSGIPAIPYKGPTLAAAVYGNIALREFGDLDILLRPQDVTAATTLLLDHGYSARYDLKPRALTTFLRSEAQYHLVLIHDQSGIMVELHWKTDPDYPVESLSADALWSQLPVAGPDRMCLRRLPTAELLLILCLHGSKHHWGKLGWLVDIAELIRQHPQLDWACVIRMAKALDAQRRLALGVYLVHRLLGVQLPAQIMATFTEAGIDKIAAHITSAMFSPQSEDASAAATLSLNLQLYQRFRQRVRHILNVVFEPSLFELSRWPLPGRLAFLYIPLRLIRLVKKHGRLLLSGRR